MAKDEEKNNEEMLKAIEAVNKRAGFDVPTAFAALNTMKVYVESKINNFPLFERQVDMGTISNVFVSATGGRFDGTTLAMLVETCVCYGYWLKSTGLSMLRTGFVRDGIRDFVDSDSKMLVEEKVKRKEAIERGFAAIDAARTKTEAGIKLHKAVKK